MCKLRERTVAPTRWCGVLLEPDFVREPEIRLSSSGFPFIAWKRGLMPRIADDFLDCVFYLYPSREAAEKGEEAGGTGFWVSYAPTGRDDAFFIFAVTNKHVVAESGASVIRLNKIGGGVDILEIEPHEWHFTGAHDLAIIHCSPDSSVHRFKAMPDTRFISHEIIAKEDIGPGDEVFMVGRFIKHDGKLTNIPSVRFGTLSMPVGQIAHPTIGMQESFAVEMRSWSGYSGSPVFVYPSSWNMNKNEVNIGNHKIFLLGIDWGHIVDHWEIREKIVDIDTAASGTPRAVPYVAANTGMNGVVPAWRLHEMLRNNPWSERMAIEMKRIEDEEAKGPKTALDSVSPATDENPNAREDFMRLSGAAAQKQKPAD